MKLMQMIRNLWIFRRVIALAVLLGVAFSFVMSNRETVKVSFPFLGEIGSTSGVVMLVSAVLGAAVCWLVVTMRRAIAEARLERSRGRTEQARPAPDRPVDPHGDGTEREGSHSPRP